MAGLLAEFDCLDYFVLEIFTVSRSEREDARQSPRN
jgi:hypothetical protein